MNGIQSTSLGYVPSPQSRPSQPVSAGLATMGHQALSQLNGDSVLVNNTERVGRAEQRSVIAEPTYFATHFLGGIQIPVLLHQSRPPGPRLPTPFMNPLAAPEGPLPS